MHKQVVQEHGRRRWEALEKEAAAQVAAEREAVAQKAEARRAAAQVAATQEATAKEAAAQNTAAPAAAAGEAAVTEAAAEITDKTPKPRPQPRMWAATHEERMAVARIQYRLVDVHGMEVEEQ